MNAPLTISAGVVRWRGRPCRPSELQMLRDQFATPDPERPLWWANTIRDWPAQIDAALAVITPEETAQ